LEKRGKGRFFKRKWMQMLFNELTGHHTNQVSANP
jgi:hypothetical protein